MYRDDANKICTINKKSIVTLRRKKSLLSCLVFFVGSFSSPIDASCFSFIFFSSGQWFLKWPYFQQLKHCTFEMSFSWFGFLLEPNFLLFLKFLNLFVKAWSSYFFWGFSFALILDSSWAQQVQSSSNVGYSFLVFMLAEKCIPCFGKTIEYYVHQFLFWSDLFNSL